MWSKYALSVEGTPKLYIGRPRTITSARRNSLISSSEYSVTACCCSVRDSGFARNAPNRSASRCGTGVRARSRTMTPAPGWAARHSSTNSCARWLDWPSAEKRLEVSWRRVVIVVSVSMWRQLNIDEIDKKAQYADQTDRI